MKRAIILLPIIIAIFAVILVSFSSDVSAYAYDHGHYPGGMCVIMDATEEGDINFYDLDDIDYHWAGQMLWYGNSGLEEDFTWFYCPIHKDRQYSTFQGVNSVAYVIDNRPYDDGELWDHVRSEIKCVSPVGNDNAGAAAGAPTGPSQDSSIPTSVTIPTLSSYCSSGLAFMAFRIPDYVSSYGASGVKGYRVVERY